MVQWRVVDQAQMCRAAGGQKEQDRPGEGQHIVLAVGFLHDISVCRSARNFTQEHAEKSPQALFALEASASTSQADMPVPVLSRRGYQFMVWIMPA